jgi:CO dehydrogenase/acetyl-CoA synthase beta subunit
VGRGREAQKEKEEEEEEEEESSTTTTMTMVVRVVGVKSVHTLPERSPGGGLDLGSVLIL